MKIRLKIIYLSLIIAGISGIFLFNPQKASAVTASDWKAGRIIDDVVFFNKDSMTVAQIQQFLDAKVPLCDTNGTQLTSRWNTAAGRYYTRAEWGASVGNPAPFTCLKNYIENVTTRENNYGRPTASISGGVSSAQIIWNVAQSNNINPQVLLVLLQKEQSLIGDDWPYIGQFDYATGAYCPDSGPGGSANCDSTKKGFANQVRLAAELFNYYKNNLSQFSYGLGQNYILWNVSPSGCGGGIVNIENVATALLYIYTPYQPNSASLANLYGTGDGCSAYGNRNFWRMFNDWFGTSYVPDYRAQYQSQSPYVTTIKQGDSQTFSVQYKNIGNTAWTDSTNTPAGKFPVRLAGTSPINRSSIFYSPTTWTTTNRPVSTFTKVYESDGVTLAADQHTVQPNQIGRFEFKMETSTATPAGSYTEWFQPILDGATGWSWNMDGWVFYSVTVVP